MPKERRFTFYDQVHTTGTDIPQTATASAVLTLSADLVFRDYAQAAYRMRGIGKGQRIVLFAIPEVQQLLDAEAARGRGITPQARAEMTGGLPTAEARAGAELDDVVAWLLLNSFRTERVQFELWCLHCAHNTWRKAAMRVLLQGAHVALSGPDDGKRRSLPGELGEDHRRARATLDTFRDGVDHSVSNSVPTLVTTRDQIAALGAAGTVAPDAAGVAAIERVLALLDGHAPADGRPLPPRREQSAAAAAAAAVAAELAAGGPEAASFGSEQEQEQEQEEEQEKEQQQQQQKEQEQEVEEPELYAKEKCARTPASLAGRLAPPSHHNRFLSTSHRLLPSERATPRVRAPAPAPVLPVARNRRGSCTPPCTRRPACRALAGTRARTSAHGHGRSLASLARRRSSSRRWVALLTCATSRRRPNSRCTARCSIDAALCTGRRMCSSRQTIRRRACCSPRTGG